MPRIAITLVLCWLAWSMSGVELVLGVTLQLGAAFGTATRDTMIFENNVDNGAGGAPGFFAGTNSQPSPRRGLIDFDVSSIPAGAVITSVELRLVIGQLAGSGGGSNPPGSLDPVIGLHKLLVSWGEADTGRSDTNVLNGTGQGTDAEEGDATWKSRFFYDDDPLDWLQPGGQPGTEYMTTASAALQQGNERYLESIWLSTPALVNDVQGWIDSPETNHGWMLINTNKTDRQTFRGFFSHDYNPTSLPFDLPEGSDLNETADFWPVLRVTYKLPLAGDFDEDGDVDGRDFLLWQRNPGIGELADWQANYGVEMLAEVEGDTAHLLIVPEPNSLVLLCLSMAGRLVLRG